MKIELGKTEIIHFVGIGGIGMSGLSLIMQEKGFKVQGSDQYINKNIARLKKENIKIFIGQKKENLKNATIVVISSAIKKNNPEIKAAAEKKIPLLSRADMLSELMKNKKSIAIAGSHGKTTTTSLVGDILSKANLDPTIVNGGIINSLSKNNRYGKGEWMVVEADESDGSFLKLPHQISILTNLDIEHLDFYYLLALKFQRVSTYICSHRVQEVRQGMTGVPMVSYESFSRGIEQRVESYL